MTEAREPDGVNAHEPAAQSGSPAPFFWAGRGARSLAFAALTLIGGSVAVVALHSGGAAGPHYRAVDTAPPAPQAIDDPLMGELARCRALPPQATDPACERAWDENRRRFLGETRATRVPGDPQPHYGPIPAPAGTAVAGPPSSPTTTRRWSTTTRYAGPRRSFATPSLRNHCLPKQAQAISPSSSRLSTARWRKTFPAGAL